MRITAPAAGLALLLALPAQAALLTYDASLGSLPEAQGWTFEQLGGAPPAPSVSGGVLYQGTTDYSGAQYWYSTALSYDFTQAPVTVDARLRIDYATFHPFPRGGYNIVLFDSAGRDAALHITSSAVFLGNDQLSGASSIVAFDTTDAFHDYRLTAGPGGISLSIDGNSIVSLALGPTTSSGLSVSFGDATILGQSQSQLQFLTVTTQDVPEPATLGVFGLGLAALTTLRRRRQGSPHRHG